MLKPVTGYLWRQWARWAYYRRDAWYMELFDRLFRADDRLQLDEAYDWPIIFCLHCLDTHLCGLEEQDEEREGQKEQRAYRKKLRRVESQKRQTGVTGSHAPATLEEVNPDHLIF